MCHGQMMSESKTMNSVIHAAFRRDLARFDEALGDFDGSAGRADDLGLAWGNFATQLRNHHEDEQRLFWPALIRLGVDESLVSDLDGEHARMMLALEAATSAMESFRANPSTAGAAAARTTIGNLRTVLVEHLDHEERDLETFAAAHLKSPEIKAAAKGVRAAHKGAAGAFFAWLVDGADDETLALLKRQAPAPVLFVLTRIAGRDYNRRIAPIWARAS
jgi:hypothetical protein